MTGSMVVFGGRFGDVSLVFECLLVADGCLNLFADYFFFWFNDF